MLGQPFFATGKKTPTTPPSGPSTAESSTPPGKKPGDPYRLICDELYRLLTRKRGYYGCGDDPLENAMGVADDGIDPVRYQVARIGEKTRRLRALKETLGVEKTLLDIAGHAVVALACSRRGDVRRCVSEGGGGS